MADLVSGLENKSRIWYQLIDASGRSFRSTSLSSTLLPRETVIVDDFRKTIQKEQSPLLDQFAFSQLLVFESLSHVKENNDLKPFATLDRSLQQQQNQCQLYVMVPSSTIPSVSASNCASEHPSSYSHSLAHDELSSMWVKFLDHEPIMLTLPSASLVFHLKKAFIESVNSPLAASSPGTIQVFKSGYSDGAKALEGNVSLKSLLAENDYTTPLVLTNNSNVNRNSVSGKIPAPSAPTVSLSSSSSHLNHHHQQPRQHSFQNQLQTGPLNARSTNLAPSATSTASPRSKDEEREEGEVEEGEISHTDQSSLVVKHAAPLMTVPIRKLAQTPTPAATASQSPRIAPSDTSSLNLNNQAPIQTVKFRDLVSKLNNVTEGSMNPSLPTASVVISQEATQPPMPALPSKIIPAASLQAPNQQQAQQVVDAEAKKPFVNIRCPTSTVPIPRRPAVINKKASSTPIHPVPPRNTPVFNASKVPNTTPGTPFVARSQIPTSAPPSVTTNNSVPPSIKIIKRPVLKTVSAPAKTATSPPQQSAVAAIKTIPASTADQSPSRKWQSPIAANYRPVIVPARPPVTVSAPLPKASQIQTLSRPSVPAPALAPVHQTLAVPLSVTPAAVPKNDERKRPITSTSAESGPPKKKLAKKASTNHNVPSPQGLLPVPNFVFQFRNFLNTGSMVEKYQPTAYPEGTKGVIRVESLLQSITAMPVYKELSIEELRFADYLACRKLQ